MDQELIDLLPQNITEFPNTIVRQTGQPLEAFTIFTTMDLAKKYMATALAYPGQLIAAKDSENDEKYKYYIIQKNNNVKTLQPISTAGIQDELDKKVDKTTTINEHSLYENIVLTKEDIGLDQVENKSSETIRSELTSKNVIDALEYTPLNQSEAYKHPETHPASMITDLADVATSGSYNDLINKPNIPVVPTNIGAFTNDAGYLTSYTETDPTVPNHVKNITEGDITNWNNKSTFDGNYNNLINKPTIPTALSSLNEDASHRTVTDAEKMAWNAKSEFSGEYDELTGIPDSFTPSTHGHNLGEISDTDNYVRMTPTERTKLFNIEPGAKVNVQSDWNQTNTGADDYIKNKPLLGTLAGKNEVLKTDLASGVQISLGNADSALQASDKTELQKAINTKADSSTVTALSNRVGINESAIAILNGAGEGSVDKKITNAFNEFAAEMSDDKTVNTYKELIDYAASHGAEFTKLVGEVDANTKTIATRAAASDLTEHIDNTSNPHNVTKAQLGLENVANTGDSATPISGGTTKFTTGGAYTELAKKVDKVDGKGLSANDLTSALKTNYDAAYEHSTSLHAPSDAEANVQSDWSVTDTTSDAYIRNKPSIPTNTWRKVQLNGADKLSTSTETNPLNIKAGSNMTITESGGTFTFTATAYQRVYPSTDNKEYPITTRYDVTTDEDYYEEYGRYSTGVTLNPSNNTITATTFNGNLTGNAATATKATQDANGNVISDTYATQQVLLNSLSAIEAKLDQLIGGEA